MVLGYESYLTAYPLPADNKFALARTWYASEMPRPGSVWTHTLLLEFADLAQIVDPRPLLSLFRRPQGPPSDGHGEYGNAIPVLQSAWSQRFNPRITPSWIAPLLQALYTSTRPVLLVAKPDDYVDELVACAWLQQWPRLRRTFRFCTGSLANRAPEVGVFDLQVVPERNVKAIRRELEDASVIEGTGEPSPASADWLQVAHADLFGHYRHSQLFHSFLRRFGPDVSSTRDNFRWLTETFLESSSIIDTQQILEDVAKRFPGPRDARFLKSWLLGDQGAWPTHAPPPLDYVDAIAWLVEAPQAKAYEPASVSLRRMVSDALVRQPRETIGILERVAPLETSFSLHLIAAATELALSDFPDYWSDITPGLALRMIAENRRVLTLPSLWTRSRDSAQRLVRLLVREKFKGDVVRLGVPAIVAARSFASISAVAEEIDGEAIPPLIDELVKDKKAIGPVWWELVSSYPDAALGWLDTSDSIEIDALASLTRGLRNQWPAVVRHGTATWLRVATLGEQWTPEDPLRADLLAFCLAVGLSDGTGEPAWLVASTFQDVHDFAERDILTPSGWAVLDPLVTQRTDWWQLGDDRPYRLRLSLADKFGNTDWPLEAFLQSARLR